MQACHACIEVARSLLRPADEHPHLVLLGVTSESSLGHILRRTESRGIRCRPFRDPDIRGELTAFATEPLRGPARRHFRKYRCLRAAGAH